MLLRKLFSQIGILSFFVLTSRAVMRTSRAPDYIAQSGAVDLVVAIDADDFHSYIDFLSWTSAIFASFILVSPETFE